MPRQHKDAKTLLNLLTTFGVKGLSEPITGDELDAATGALTGWWYLQGHGEMIGGEAGIILPVLTRH